MKNIFTILQSHKEIIMTSKEKQDLWENISKATFDMPMNNTVRNSVPSRLYGIGPVPIKSKFFTTKKRAATALLGGMVFLGGVAAYAQETIPGDFLYPVKTGVIEKAMALVSVSPESKAKLSIKLTNERLIETEKLAIKGKFDDKAKNQLDSSLSLNADELNKNLVVLDSMGKVSIADDLNKDFHTSLAVHAAVLNSLVANSNNKSLIIPLGENANEINKYLFSYADKKIKSENTTDEKNSLNAKTLTTTSSTSSNENNNSNSLNIDLKQGEFYLKQIKNEVGIPESINIVIDNQIDSIPVVKEVKVIPKLKILKKTTQAPSPSLSNSATSTTSSNEQTGPTAKSTTSQTTTINVVPVVETVTNVINTATNNNNTPTTPVNQVVQPITNIVTPLVPIVSPVLP